MAKGLSPTQRTIRALKEQGMKCAVVEKWNQFVGAHGVRQDLFGIIDVLALDPERGVIGIQCCGSDFKAHMDKITDEHAQDTLDWLKTPGTALQIWAWRKVSMKRGGKAQIWSPRVKEITIDDIGREDA